MLWLLACAAPEPTVDSDPAAPDIRLSPSEIDFGESSESVSADLTIENLGEEMLNAFVHSVSLQVEASDPAVTEVAPGEEAVVALTWRPDGNEALDSVVVVESDAPDARMLEVPMIGQGVAGVLSAEHVDFGSVELGCASTSAIIVTNTGTGALEVDAPTLTGSAAFSVAAESIELEPGAVGAVVVSFSPLHEGADEAWVRLGDAEIRLAGVGLATETVDIFDMPDGTQPVDVLFAVGSGSSMDAVRADLHASTDVLVEELGGDWQIGVVLDDDGCMADSFTDEPGNADNGGQTFMLLEAGLKDSSLAEGGCNEGFLRDAGTLHLVGVSDQAESSVNPSSYYRTLFQGLKVEADDVAFHALGGPPGGCEGAVEYGGIWDLAEDSGGVTVSICDDDVVGFLRALGSSATTQPGRYLELSAVPVPETVEVRVDGVLVEGWGVDDQMLELAAVPGAGSIVHVEFVEDACPTE